VKSISTVLNRSMLIVSFIRPAVERSPTFRERPCLRAPEPRDELPPLHLRPPEICQQIYRPGCIAVLTAVIKSRPSLHASGLLGTRRGLQAVNARMRQVVSTLGPHVRRCPTGPRRGVMVGRPRHCVRGRQAGSAPRRREEGRIGGLGCGLRAQGRHAGSKDTGEDHETDHQLPSGWRFQVSDISALPPDGKGRSRSQRSHLVMALS
jgi:hypothetical protein